MAKLSGSIDFPTSFANGAKEQLDALEALRVKSDSLPEGEVKGALIKFPVADGYAHYVVVNDRPLEVRHVPFLDGYRVHPALIRGLTIKDVREHVARDRRLASLFDRRSRRDNGQPLDTED